MWQSVTKCCTKPLLQTATNTALAHTVEFPRIAWTTATISPLLKHNYSTSCWLTSLSGRLNPRVLTGHNGGKRRRQVTMLQRGSISKCWWSVMWSRHCPLSMEPERHPLDPIRVACSPSTPSVTSDTFRSYRWALSGQIVWNTERGDEPALLHSCNRLRSTAIEYGTQTGRSPKLWSVTSI